MKLAYREYGEGRPMVILHGLFGQSDNWNTLAKQFAASGLRVFTVDLRNHGLSPHSDAFNYTVLSEDLFEFIITHQLDDPILLGHSLGGKTVLFHEYAHPGIAGRIIIADMAARSYPAHHDHVLEALNSVNFDELRSRKEVEARLAQHINEAGTRQFLLKNLYWQDEEHKKLGWRFNLPAITSHYREVNLAVPPFRSDVPALVLRGELSHYVNEEDVMDYKMRFANVKISTIRGAAHWLHAEKPGEFFSAVLDFISA
jgi:esterase